MAGKPTDDDEATQWVRNPLGGAAPDFGADDPTDHDRTNPNQRPSPRLPLAVDTDEHTTWDRTKIDRTLDDRTDAPELKPGARSPAARLAQSAPAQSAPAQSAPAQSAPAQSAPQTRSAKPPVVRRGVTDEIVFEPSREASSDAGDVTSSFAGESPGFARRITDPPALAPHAAPYRDGPSPLSLSEEETLLRRVPSFIQSSHLGPSHAPPDVPSFPGLAMLVDEESTIGMYLEPASDGTSPAPRIFRDASTEGELSIGRLLGPVARPELTVGRYMQAEPEPTIGRYMQAEPERTIGAHMRRVHEPEPTIGRYMQAEPERTIGAHMRRVHEPAAQAAPSQPLPSPRTPPPRAPRPAKRTDDARSMAQRAPAPARSTAERAPPPAPRPVAPSPHSAATQVTHEPTNPIITIGWTLVVVALLLAFLLLGATLVLVALTL